MNKHTVNELRKLKEKELEEVIKEIKKLEKEVDRKNCHSDNMETHVGKLKKLDKLYLRRRELKDFLKELKLVRSGEKGMLFEKR